VIAIDAHHESLFSRRRSDDHLMAALKIRRAFILKGVVRELIRSCMRGRR
jgi:hypothetical protein